MKTNTVYILPTFSMPGLIETEDSHTACIQTLPVPQQGGTRNCTCGIQMVRKVQTTLELVEKQLDLVQVFRVPR